ncbi:hypothetical protein CIPAW_04G130900 [Carya illinoinensis]|uniref:Uncharacterized protein n=1 Tax=Carya illinoinensis TaxID=32201 RepID=A0A8T1QUA9_CARIL|nr:hypothetical protein CIPAW_04G130900 [Carya illinoinensis]
MVTPCLSLTLAMLLLGLDNLLFNCLNDVILVVPKIKNDLISVSRLTTDFPLVFEFDGHDFVIKDRTFNQIVAKGRKQKGLCTFDSSPADGGLQALFST